jgi:hypothetical protein
MNDRTPRLERFLERALDLGAGGSVHPAELLQKVHQAAEASVQDATIANAYTVTVPKGGGDELIERSSALTKAIETMLDDLVRSRSLRQHAPWQVQVRAAAGTGPARVVAEFRNESNGAVAPRGVTRAITRHRGVALRVEGVGSVAITHTPFSIGRSGECDLTVADLAISRRHAVVENDGAGFVLKDAGSRNLIETAEGSVRELRLADGVSFRLGGTQFTFGASV